MTLICLLFSFLCVISVFSVNAHRAFAETKDVALQELKKVEQSVSKVLDNGTKLDSYEYLYNLDDSADYILIFEVDPDTMKIDEAKYLADIERYGLFTYEEFLEQFDVPEVIFEAFGGQYLKVALGKGILTEERIAALIERYAPMF